MINIADALDQRIASAEPSTRGRLRELRAEFGGEPMSAERLHNIRSDLSDTVAEADRVGRKKQVAALSEALGEIDAALNNVPGYADARRLYADSYEIERAIDAGRGALDGGSKTAVSPQQLRGQLDRMKPGEHEAFKRGVREYVFARMGTARNAPATAQADLSKEWNREKLALVLGDEQAGEIFQRIDAEKSFGDTCRMVNQGSQTQRRQASEAGSA